MLLKANAQQIQKILDAAIAKARQNNEGEPADYIPELASVNLDLTSAAVMNIHGQCYRAGDEQHIFTLQSVAKLIVLIGLLEEFGIEQVLQWVNVEPSGRSFASIEHLSTENHQLPANPLINPGAITLCSYIPGATTEARVDWLEAWLQRLLNIRPRINQRVFISERRTGDMNRALAYLMRQRKVISGNVEEILETYFSLCSYEADVNSAAHLAMILANDGLDCHGQTIIARETACQVIAIMATCGMYDESGAYLVRTGMPGKSGVSGLIVAVSPGRCGVAVASPRINHKGGSVRGHIILKELSQHLGLHFANNMR